MIEAKERIAAVRAAFPAEGFFQDKEWQLSPSAFPLNREVVDKITRLGPALRHFLQACTRLYLHEQGEVADWVRALLDAGKPDWILNHARQAIPELPRVLRPDLILTERGVSLAEIDSVPGGMGLTAWLNQTYAALGDAVIGGAEGMRHGFEHAFPQHEILVSTEAADYAPEMRWLAAQLPWKPRVWHPSEWHTAPKDRPYYRFFELFDLPQVEHAKDWIQSIPFSPPILPFLEEKLWLALFHLPQLRSYWSALLTQEDHALLMECIPQGWVLHPQPLPEHAVYPGLEIHSWQELKKLGRKARELVLKISGFSPLGWGSRGVHIGHDLSQADWAAVVEAALASYPEHPYLLQCFEKGRVVVHPAWNEAVGLPLQKRSRVRLCPYYFGEKAELCGVLATVCPEDKKVLHGMKDALMLPCTERD